MSAPEQGRGRLQLLLIALVFFGPLVVAAWMYMTGSLVPQGRSNAGVLLEPVVSLADVAPGSPVTELLDGHWVLLYANDASCAGDCREALYRMRQARQMVGRERDRLQRVFLHGDNAPDTVFLEGEHPGLITTSDKALAGVLASKLPEGTMPGGIYLIDPLANLVIYFPPDLDPRDMVDDIKHLLRLSQIG